MTEIAILSSASELTEDQQKQLLSLHYSFLNYQRSVLDISNALPELRVAQLFAGNRIAVTLVAGRVVGYCVYRIISGLLKLRTVYVAEEYRRQGKMAALLEVINAREVYGTAELTVFQKCTAARNLFARLGFVAKELDGWLTMVFDKKSHLSKTADSHTVPA